MRRPAIISILLLIAIQVNGADDISTDNLRASVRLPSFNASVSFGFNYDLLRAPTDVSFDYSQGFFGFNLPLEQSVDLRSVLNYANPAIDSIFADSAIFTNGEDFRPRGKARQNPNMTVRVDVPMMGGVASFSNTQNFFMAYQNILGNPDVFVNPDSLGEGISFLMRGTISVPVNLSMSWETMTFGYAYKINRYLTMALNLHRHLFTMDLRSKVDVNLLGRLKYESINKELDYPSDKVFGRAYGHYDAEVWTPTIGIEAWRFNFDKQVRV